jgi:hypothetical protein
MTDSTSSPQPTWDSIAWIGVIWILLVIALATLDLRSVADTPAGHARSDRSGSGTCAQMEGLS